AVRASAGDPRLAALHLVRFLRAADVDLSADAVARNVRPAIDGRSGGWRAVGVFLQQRPALDAIRTVIESAGPPGVTSIGIFAPSSSGLRTARLQLARAARLAGYQVLDRRFATLECVSAPAGHVCVLDWFTEARGLPALLSIA